MTGHGDRGCSDGRAGSVLIFTLWILVCLTLMSLGLSHRVRLEAKATTYTRANIEAFYLAETALYTKLGELATPRRRGRQQDNAQTPQSARKRKPKAGEEEVEIRCVAASEEGKININRAPEDLLRRLKFVKGSVFTAIMKRRRGEDMKEGTKDDESFRLPEELLMEAKIDPEDWYGGKRGKPGIRDLITVYGEGRIDLNSAPLEVLAAIPGVSRRVAQDIVAYREGPDMVEGTADDWRWKSVSALKEAFQLSNADVAPFEEYCSFESNFYGVTVAARKKSSRATARISAVARVEDGKFEVVSWREDY